MKRAIFILILSITTVVGFGQRRHPYYGGGRHTTSHGGHYSGGTGSHHHGGHYVNPRTSNTYGRHKRY